MQNSKLQFKIQKLKNIYHLLQAIIVNFIYGFPSRKIKVIGVTGTDGKTTTVHLIYHILKTAGKKVSMISTVHAKVAEKEYYTGFHITTPSSFFIQRSLKQAVNHGDDFFILETTSHGIDQNRVWGIRYEIAVITNITHEHLDYHQTFEHYVLTKMKLLKMAKISLVNKDDESFKQTQKLKIPALPAGRKIQNYSSKFKILNKLPLLTKFNQYNYSAGYAVCRLLGISDEIILKGMKSFKLPSGRLEIVYNKDFTVIIDFAHTPNALEQILPSIRHLYLRPEGRLIHVFGSAGLRDFTKRPLMGRASGKYADVIILTEEDYRTEDPMKICQSISQGINKPFEIIIDREKAINKAIGLAKKGDCVLITGKGHEKSLCRGKKEFPWDEKKIVLNSLKNYDFL